MYKNIVMQLLEQNPEIYERLRSKRALLPTLEYYAYQLKDNHQAWQNRLLPRRPGSDPSQIASEAMEIALKELEENLASRFLTDEMEPLSQGGAMAYIRQPMSDE